MSPCSSEVREALERAGGRSEDEVEREAKWTRVTSAPSGLGEENEP
jgi:hypothetical protein